VRAAVCPEYGPPEVVRVEDVASLSTADGQVRVRIAAAAVNYPDVLLVADRYQISVAPPFVPGSEFAGIVDEVGAGVRGFAVGDRVMGTAMVGAFAEQAVVPVAALRAVPPGLELATAAAFGVAHRTAYHTLRSVAELRAGEELVVLGAGGGVGLAAVQLGRELGANVTAVASSADKLEVAAAAGASHLIEHTSQDLRQALRSALPDGADVVIDPVGGRLSEPALRALRFGGRFVTIGYAAGEIPRIPLNLVLLKGIQIHGFQLLEFGRRRPEEFERNEAELTALLAAGRATPHIGATFPLDETAAALRCVADGRAIGKVVITVP
jgi:NADPH2:quinone reductase